MKIAIVHLDLSEPMGDTLCVGSLARAFKKLGHDISVWTPVFDAGPFSELWKGLDVHIVEYPVPFHDVMKYISSPSPVQKIIGKLKARKWSRETAKLIAAALPKDLDVLDCHNWYSYRVAKFYRTINPNCKIFWTMHDMPSNWRHKKNPVTNILSWVQFKLEPYLEKGYYRYTDEVIVMDKHSFPIAEKASRKPTTLIYLGLDYPHFEQPVKIRPEFKNGNVTLLGVGALSPYRRYEDIVDAVSILRKKGIEASAMIVCRDAWGNPGYRKEFDAFVQASDATPYVTLNYEGVSAEGLLETFRNTDIFVFPNDIEIWGMAAFEAMASGMPVIVSNVTSVSMVLKDRETALFVDPRKPEQIAARTEEMLKNQELYLSIARNGQKFVKETLSWDAYAQRIVEMARGK